MERLYKWNLTSLKYYQSTVKGGIGKIAGKSVCIGR